MYSIKIVAIFQECNPLLHQRIEQAPSISNIVRLQQVLVAMQQCGILYDHQLAHLPRSLSSSMVAFRFFLQFLKHYLKGLTLLLYYFLFGCGEIIMTIHVLVLEYQILTNPYLIIFQLKCQSNFAAVFIQHTRQRLRWQMLLDSQNTRHDIVWLTFI